MPPHCGNSKMGAKVGGAFHSQFYSCFWKLVFSGVLFSELPQQANMRRLKIAPKNGFSQFASTTPCFIKILLFSPNLLQQAH